MVGRRPKDASSTRAYRGMQKSALATIWDKPRGGCEPRKAPGLLDVLGNAGYPIGLLKDVGELVRLHLMEAHEDEMR